MYDQYYAQVSSSIAVVHWVDNDIEIGASAVNCTNGWHRNIMLKICKKDTYYLNLKIKCIYLAEKECRGN